MSDPSFRHREEETRIIWKKRNMPMQHKWMPVLCNQIRQIPPLGAERKRHGTKKTEIYFELSKEEYPI